MSSPDPVKEARAYQQMLLDAASAAGDDPAEVQAETIGALRAALSHVAGRDPRRADGEWTALGVALHLVHAELVMSGRYRWALAHDNPPVYGYDQDLWVDRLAPIESSAEDLLELFTVLRNSNLKLWRAASVEQRQRTVLHSERGPESFDLMFRMIAGHDRVHLGQIDDSPEGGA